MQKLESCNGHPRAGWALLASMLMMVLFLVQPTSAWARDVQNVNWQRLAGDNAYGTMAAIAQEGWESSDVVVVAALEGYWDALSASSVAGANGAPVLLTGQDGLAPGTAAEIKRLGAKRAYVVGGPYWIPDGVLGELRGLGLSVERLAGGNAAATSVAVAGKLAEASDVAIVATDRSYHDALAASPFAYAKRAPIFLTEGGGSRLPVAAISAIEEGGFGRIVVAGGEASVSPAAFAQLKATGIPVERLAGDNAYLTAEAFSAWEVRNGMSWAEMGVATCSSHYDALTGGALCGLRGGVLMLADDASNAAAVARAGANKSTIGRARVFGGTFSVGGATFAALERATMSQEADSSDAPSNPGGSTDPSPADPSNPSTPSNPSNPTTPGSSDPTPSGPSNPSNPGSSPSTSQTTCTVTFEDGLGNVISKQTLKADGSVTLPADPTRKDYACVGWNTEPNGTGWFYNAGGSNPTSVTISESVASYYGNAVTLYAQWQLVEPLRFLDEDQLEGNHPIGKSFDLDMSNPIATVQFSDDRIVYQVPPTYQPTSSLRLVANEIGTVTITITDVYGYTVKHTTNTVLSEYFVDTFSSSRYDASLKVPAISSYEGSKDYFSVNCPAMFPGPKGETGYQMYVTGTSQFNNVFDMTWADYEWNNLGYAKLSVFYPGARATRYVKVRSYRTEGTTMVYGPWSKVSTFETPDFSQVREGKAKYSYDCYLVKNGTSGLYDGVTSVLYVKTDNPDPSSFDFYSQGKSFFKNHVMRDWDDIDYAAATDSDSYFRKVKGGYVANIQIDEPGTYQVELREANSDGYVTAKTVTLKVQDYAATRDAWMDKVIAEVSKPGMNSLEKMEAVASYLVSNNVQAWGSTEKQSFTYLVSHEGYLVSLAKRPNMPWFEVLRWDSATSPSMLCVFAERIGGFDEIHNCYGDYARGTTEWMMYHHMARITFQGEQHYFTVCPDSSSGEVKDYTKVNFSPSGGDLVKLG